MPMAFIAPWHYTLDSHFPSQRLPATLSLLLANQSCATVLEEREGGEGREEREGERAREGARAREVWQGETFDTCWSALL